MKVASTIMAPSSTSMSFVQFRSSPTSRQSLTEVDLGRDDAPAPAISQLDGSVYRSAEKLDQRHFVNDKLRYVTHRMKIVRLLKDNPSSINFVRRSNIRRPGSCSILRTGWSARKRRMNSTANATYIVIAAGRGSSVGLERHRDLRTAYPFGTQYHPT